MGGEVSVGLSYSALILHECWDCMAVYGGPRGCVRLCFKHTKSLAEWILDPCLFKWRKGCRCGLFQGAAMVTSSFSWAQVCEAAVPPASHQGQRVWQSRGRRWDVWVWTEDLRHREEEQRIGVSTATRAKKRKVGAAAHWRRRRGGDWTHSATVAMTAAVTHSAWSWLHGRRGHRGNLCTKQPSFQRDCLCTGRGGFILSLSINTHITHQRWKDRGQRGSSKLTPKARGHL